MSSDEREWQAQEQARRDVAAGATSSPANRDYRQIAHVLRQSPPPALPLDFASRVATLAQASAAPDMQLEGWITRVLGGMFAVAMLSCLALYGQDWLRATWALLPAGDITSRNAAVAIALCAAMTWCIGRYGERGIGSDWVGDARQRHPI